MGATLAAAVTALLSLMLLAAPTNSTSDEETTALISLYISCQGKDWTNNTNWSKGDPCEDAWYGVECSAQETVLALRLQYNNLRGVLPKELGLLVHLETLALSGNSILDPLPDSIVHLQSLSTLDLSRQTNGLNMTEAIGNLTALQYFSFADNDAAALPSSFTQLSFLQHLDLAGNVLQYPDLQIVVERFPRLLGLDMARNRLDGPFPALTNNSALRWLNLASNTLSGMLPDMKALDQMELLSLDDNKLTGPFPLWWTQWENVAVLNFARNAFTGTLPVGQLACVKLAMFSADHNQLQGPIPQSFVALKNLRMFDVGFNHLDSFVPVLKLPLLDYIDLQNNAFSGSFPANFTLSPVSYLNLGNNNLEGEFPVELLSRSSNTLTSLVLNSNLFSNDDILQHANTPFLKRLDVSYNNFSGTLPQKWKSYQLDVVDLHHNHFSGTLSSFSRSASSLSHLNIANNRINGSLPTYFLFPNLKTFSASSNNIEGDLPVVVLLPRLKVWDLSRNFITGPVTDDFGQLLSLEVLQMHHNQIDGDVPTVLQSLRLLRILDLSYNQITHLTGVELINLPNLVLFDVRYNNITMDVGDVLVPLTEQSDAVPRVMRSCYLHYNQLDGSLPDYVDRIADVKVLNLSHNAISGDMPISLQNVEYILDISANPFVCPVPQLGREVTCADPCCETPSPDGGAINNIVVLALTIIGTSLLICACICGVYGTIEVAKSVWRTRKAKKKQEERAEPDIAKPDPIVEFLREHDANVIHMADLRLQKCLASGQCGEVWKGIRDGRVVAVKRLNLPDLGVIPHVLEDLIDEARLAMTCNSKYITRFIGVAISWTTNTQIRGVGLVFEYMDYGNLYDLLRYPEVKWTLPLKLQVLCDAASGMNYLHGKTPPVLHRDLNTKNLLVNRKWVCKLSDFAFPRTKEHTMVALRYKNAVAEVPQALDSEIRKIDEKSDVLAFGAIMHEVYHATDKDHHSEVNVRTLKNVVFPPECPVAYADLARSCLDPDPTQRPAFSDILNMLRELKDELVAKNHSTRFQSAWL